MDLVEVAPDRAGCVDSDGELDRTGRVNLVEVASDRVGGIDRDGDVVMIDPENAKMEGGTPLVFTRFRGGSFGTEDGGSVTL